MSDLNDEFIIEEDEGPSNRPFLVAAGSLIGLLVLSLICLGAVRTLGLGGGGGVEPGEDPAVIAQNDAMAATATSISATNEAIAQQNELVTQTIVALTETAAAPTETPTPSPTMTNTPTPEPSPTPTETPVVGEGEDDGEGEGDENGDTVGDGSLATATPNLAATEIFSGLNTATPVGGPGTGGGTGGGTLPETGLPLWGGLVAALGLLLLLFGARRLRTG